MEGEGGKVFQRRAEGVRRRERKEKTGSDSRGARDRGSKISPITSLTKTLYDTQALKTYTRT